MRQLSLDLTPGLIEELEIRTVRPSKRPLREENGSIDELMTSIVQHGLLEPIIVRPSGRGFEVVAGNRRFEACRRLRMRRILATVVELGDKEAFEVSLTENVQHMTLNPIEEGEAFKRYVDEFGYGGESELARQLGKSVSYINRRIGFLRLPPRVRDELLRRRKSPALAQELLSLDEENVNIVTDLLINSKNITRKEMREIIGRSKSGLRTAEDGCGSLGVSEYATQEIRRRVNERVLSKSIASLKLCLHRLDDIYGHLDKEMWLLREVLERERGIVNSRIDELIKLKRKFARFSELQ